MFLIQKIFIENPPDSCILPIGRFIFHSPMTHFFLHGGKTGVASEKNIHFFQTLGTYGNNILIFPFGIEKPEEGYKEYRERFIKNNPDKKLFIECADRNIPTLIKQIQNSDVLFFSGGKPYQQFEVINQIENFKELIKDKVIAGTSGGAIMRAYAYYSSNAENLREGNHFIPIKIIAHRLSQSHNGLSWQQREKLLDAYGEKLPIYKLPEQEYIEFIM